MKPDLPKLEAHAAAVTAFNDDLVTRLNALVSAKAELETHDRSPLRNMTIQSLDKAIMRGMEFQGAASSYGRMIDQYLAQVGKAQA